MTDIAAGTSSMPSRSADLRRTLLATALALAGGLSMTLACAPQAHAQSFDVGKPAAAQINASKPDALSPNVALAWPCGYHTRPLRFLPDAAWYNHCGPTRICIRVGVRQWFDYPLEVGPGHTYLGPTSEIHGAWYTGLPPC
jgi:hypothetical protein